MNESRKQELLEKREQLVLEKRRIELDLAEIRAAIVGHGQLPKAYYASLVTDQNHGKARMLQIETELSTIKLELRKFALDEASTPRSQDKYNPSPVISSLEELRHKYAAFYKDKNKPQSEREMACLFASELEPIIKGCVRLRLGVEDSPPANNNYAERELNVAQ